MKKLAVIGLGAYVFFGAWSGSLAAYRMDNPNGVGAAARIPWSESGTNVHFLFVNERLYPDVATTRSLADFGNQERADAAQGRTSATDTQPDGLRRRHLPGALAGATDHPNQNRRPVTPRGSPAFRISVGFRA